MSKADLDEGFFNFRSRYFYGPSGALRSDPTRVDYSKLADLVKDLDPATAAIAVYTGLQSDRTAFGVRAIDIIGADITPDLDSGDPRYPTHEVLTDGSLSPLASPASWMSSINDYYTKVHVRRSGNAPAALVNTTWDPKCSTFIWKDEIKKMVDENLGQLAAGERATLMLSNYAMYHGDETAPRHFNGPHGLRHSFCFYMQKLNADDTLGEPMLDDGNVVSPYRFRGTNLGHLCPPRCRRTTDAGSA